MSSEHWVRIKNKHGVETDIPESRLEDMLKNGAVLVDSFQPEAIETPDLLDIERKEFSHAVIIRFHYPKDNPKFEWRFSYFRSMVLPRLLSQDNQNFVIAIWCEDWHRKRFEGLSDRIVTFDIKTSAKGFIRPEDRDRSKEHGGLYFIDFTYWKDVVGLDEYDIQTGIDSDDLIIRNDFIDRIEIECSRAPGSLHISFQPYVFETRTLRTYDYPIKYSPTKGSPFFSLYQPDKDNYRFAFEDSHLKMGNFADESILIKEGYCAFSAHDFNESSTVPEGSTQVMI